MKVAKFASVAPRIQAALQEGTQTVESLKATVPTTPLKQTWAFAGEGDGWNIFTLFGRRILFRAEVEWSSPEPESRVAAYLEEWNEDKCVFVWTSLDVYVVGGKVPEDDEGVMVSPEWFLLESVLSALQSRSVVFRSEVPNRTR